MKKQRWSLHSVLIFLLTGLVLKTIINPNPDAHDWGCLNTAVSTFLSWAHLWIQRSSTARHRVAFILAAAWLGSTWLGRAGSTCCGSSTSCLGPTMAVGWAPTALGFWRCGRACPGFSASHPPTRLQWWQLLANFFPVPSCAVPHTVLLHAPQGGTPHSLKNIVLITPVGFLPIQVLHGSALRMYFAPHYGREFNIVSFPWSKLILFLLSIFFLGLFDGSLFFKWILP